MRVYFTTDIHGSDRCWLKFLASVKYYNADIIVVGGDLTGKAMVPIVARNNSTFDSDYMGIPRHMKGRDEVDALLKQIANSGNYGVVLSEEEYGGVVNNEPIRDALIVRLICERVAKWVALADERLAGTGIRCYVSPGNDDFFEIDGVLAASQTITVPDGKVVEIGDGFEMLSLGFANETPWQCPRDLPEAQLESKLQRLASEVKHMDRAIFNVHVPPYGTGLDEAPRLDSTMRVIVGAFGQPEMVPTGSTAVREAIMKYQPMLGLHGHIHESAGIRKLGMTTVVNPGSEYGEGILRGAIIELDARIGLTDVRLVTG